MSVGVCVVCDSLNLFFHKVKYIIDQNQQITTQEKKGFKHWFIETNFFLIILTSSQFYIYIYIQ